MNPEPDPRPSAHPAAGLSAAHQQQLHQVIEQAIADLRSEQADDCISSCELALRLQPDCAEAFLLLGLTSLLLGEPARAATLITKAYDLRSDTREFAQAISVVNVHLGKLTDGLFYTKLATTLPPHPDFPDILPPPYDDFLANVEEAKPGLYRARAQRLLTEGNYGNAVEAAAEQLAITPGDRDSLYVLTTASRQAGAHERSLASARALVHGDDSQPNDFVVLAQALTADGQFAAADQLLAATPCHGTAAAMSARAVNAVRDPVATDADCHAIHQHWATAQHPQQRPRRRTRQKGAPLRIGYLSSRFHDSSLARLIAPVIAGHTANGSEVYCYTDSQRHDLTSEQLANTATRWTNLASIDDPTAARILDGDRLDIAIDLTGHLPGNRLSTLSLCTIPVTASWFGYPHPCGLDNFITTRTIWPNPADGQGDAFAYMADPLIPYAPPATILAVNDAPILTNGYVTFGAVADVAQLGHTTIATWNEVFVTDPTARIVILGTKRHDTASIDRCYSAFADFGLRDRIDIIDAAANFATNFEFYHHIDIALTPPSARLTDLCQALWMGVPVLSTVSPRSLDRGAASILSAANRSEWIARDSADLATIAQGLCQDHQSLAATRASLRSQVSASPLADVQRAANQLETVYRDLVAGAVS